LRALVLAPRLLVEKLPVGQRAAPLQEFCGNDPQRLFATTAIRFAFGWIGHRA